MGRRLRLVWGTVLVAATMAGTLSLVGGAGPTGFAGAAPSCSAGTCTVTFPYSGAEQSFTVPAGVKHVTITAKGAQGGAGSGGDTGGKGARVQGDALTVSPGATLHVVVGGEGTSANDVGGGGGGSFVWSGATPSPSDLLIAAAGGGGSWAGTPGGAGSSTTVAGRGHGDTAGSGGTGGGGGGGGGGVTATGGGGGGGGGLVGDGGSLTGGNNEGGHSLESGAAGGSTCKSGTGIGGFGGGGGSCETGGGGGGGYNGGGGGGTGGAGGGGGSYVATSAKGESGTNGENPGNGEVVISYRTPTILYVRAGSHGTTCTAATKGTAAADACGSIQSAVTKADAGSGTVLVTVGPGTYAEHTITITGSSLTSLTIRGKSSSATVVDPATAGRGFRVKGGTVAIDGLTVEHGLAADTGGSLYWLCDGDCTTFSGGGGIVNDTTGHLTAVGDLLVDDSAGSTGYGGGILSSGPLTALQDTFWTDSASTRGGGVFVGTSPLGSTISPAFVNDTFLHDTATDGGGVYFDERTVDGVTEGTFVTSSIVGYTPPVTVDASILETSACSVIAGGSITGTHDVETGDSCAFTTSTTTTTATSLHLSASLAPNTAATAPPTLALGPTSAAIDVVPHSQCSATAAYEVDERGVARPGVPGQTSCDAGAFEYQALPLAFTSSSIARFQLRVDTAFTVTTSGYPGATITERGTLPTGLTFTPVGTGKATISGTPSPRDKRSYSIRLTATNGVTPPAVQRLTIDIGTGPVY